MKKRTKSCLIKNSGKISLSLALLFIFICLIGGVNAVECNADLSQGGDSCTVSSSLTLNGSYNVNMNGTTVGTIKINDHNIILDCNGSIITGNYSDNPSSLIRGIQIGIKRNITVKNCVVKNYYYGLYASSSIGLIINSTFENNYIGINLDTGGWYNNSVIANSTFNNNSYSGIRFNQVYDLIRYTI